LKSKEELSSARLAEKQLKEKENRIMELGSQIDAL
jgi:hypothetical protein